MKHIQIDHYYYNTDLVGNNLYIYEIKFDDIEYYYAATEYEDIQNLAKPSLVSRAYRMENFYIHHSKLTYPKSDLCEKSRRVKFLENYENIENPKKYFRNFLERTLGSVPLKKIDFWPTKTLFCTDCKKNINYKNWSRHEKTKVHLKNSGEDIPMINCPCGSNFNGNFQNEHFYTKVHQTYIRKKNSEISSLPIEKMDY